ncbi:ABC transporter ATP-binding protein [Caproicibacter fermentans]|uniref:ATP-binding cassette domain-containing protein n=1 Tax=Caproicibacter fermentans TaxID=2576756 RepID=A0A7G8TAC4_9FIRM|nr:oligopeptide/dipeptide ABC transporter ATP-binding protein [Caproicibacter fermentans]QNK40565.1 ATP-binding cassette domain-containing protein [Caproicibacter fermentans]
MTRKLNDQTAQKVLETRNLSKWFAQKYGIADRISGKPQKYVKAVSDVSIQIYRGENLGLVGESGCGKSTLARTILRLYEPTKGRILLNGTDITGLRGEELRKIRPAMQMVFQDPYSSLNPRMTVSEILSEMLSVHHVVPKQQIPERVKELLDMCGLGSEAANRFPGEFSGGQRQRVGIARALSLNPEFMIADEPVSALDVSIQAQIINLLGELQRSLNLTILFISHDLHVVRYITHRIVVMYLGSVVEQGGTEQIFQQPLHPYTDVLIKATPGLNPLMKTREYAITGEPPSPVDIPSGCVFHPRCTRCKQKCKTEVPALREVLPGRFVACHYPLTEEQSCAEKGASSDAKK